VVCVMPSAALDGSASAHESALSGGLFAFMV